MTIEKMLDKQAASICWFIRESKQDKNLKAHGHTKDTKITLNIRANGSWSLVIDLS